MAAYNKFNQFAKDVIDAKHNFGTHTFKVMLTNAAPVATNTAISDITDIAAGNGYTAGGSASAITDSTLAGVAKVVGTNVVFTAAGGSIGPFRYAVLYNATAAGGPLIAWWDYGANLTLADTETLTVVFDAVNGIFTLT